MKEEKPHPSILIIMEVMHFEVSPLFLQLTRQQFKQCRVICISTKTVDDEEEEERKGRL